MSRLTIVVLLMIFVEFIVALVFRYGLHGDIYREEDGMGAAMRRLEAESPRSAIIVKISYGLILLEFFIVIVVHCLGIN